MFELEAMVTKVPVVTTGGSGLLEIIANGEAGSTVCPSNSGSLVGGNNDGSSQQRICGKT